MPNKDGTGPEGKGSKTGDQNGNCGGKTNSGKKQFGLRDGSGKGQGRGMGRRNQNQN